MADNFVSVLNFELPDMKLSVTYSYDIQVNDTSVSENSKIEVRFKLRVT